jgi:hypothetical protein
MKEKIQIVSVGYIRLVQRIDDVRCSEDSVRMMAREILVWRSLQAKRVRAEFEKRRWR